MRIRQRDVSGVFASALAAAAILTGQANAQVRREPAVADTITTNPARIDNALFGPNGYFLIAGGVVPHGGALFAREGGGIAETISANAITPVAKPGGGMALQFGGRDYAVGAPPGLVCPLARFVQRDGLIAYTVVHYMNEASPQAIIRAGLARRRVAKEFDGTPFEPLLRAADFAATTPLPDGKAHAIAAAINESNGIGAFVLRASVESEKPVGSYINTDLQVTYKVYLMDGIQRVEVAGVPLRYYWELDTTGTPGVFSVEALAQNWGADARLSDWSAADVKPTQYDIVNFYQVAGLLRALHGANAQAFGTFVQQACRQ